MGWPRKIWGAVKNTYGQLAVFERLLMSFVMYLVSCVSVLKKYVKYWMYIFLLK